MSEIWLFGEEIRLLTGVLVILVNMGVCDGHGNRRSDPAVYGNSSAPHANASTERPHNMVSRPTKRTQKKSGPVKQSENEVFRIAIAMLLPTRTRKEHRKSLPFCVRSAMCPIPQSVPTKHGVQRRAAAAKDLSRRRRVQMRASRAAIEGPSPAHTPRSAHLVFRYSSVGSLTIGQSLTRIQLLRLSRQPEPTLSRTPLMQA